jgi:hypothetical protein
MHIISRLVSTKGLKAIIGGLITYLEDNPEEECSKELKKDLSRVLKSYEEKYYSNSKAKMSPNWKCWAFNSHSWNYDSLRDNKVTWRTCSRCEGRQRGVLNTYNETIWDWS